VSQPDAPHTEEQRRKIARFDRRVARTLASMQDVWRWKWFYYGLPAWLRLVITLWLRIAAPILAGVGIGSLLRAGWPPFN
jgi:hypothetical protein